MGTSSSYRSPDTARWRAFLRALQTGQPLERVRFQLFVAGETQWRHVFAVPSLAAFAESLVEAHGSLSDALAASERPDVVISDTVRRAREACFDEDYSPAIAVAERALRSVLLETTRGQGTLVGLGGLEAAANWSRARGDPARLVQRFLGELVGEWAAHAVSRDGAQLVGPEGMSTRELRALTADLKASARRVADDVDVGGIDAGSVGERWQALVHETFARGRTAGSADGA